MTHLLETTFANILDRAVAALVAAFPVCHAKRVVSGVCPGHPKPYGCWGRPSDPDCYDLGGACGWVRGCTRAWNGGWMFQVLLPWGEDRARLPRETCVHVPPSWRLCEGKRVDPLERRPCGHAWVNGTCRGPWIDTCRG
jgi:hypothetical protein